MNEKESIIEALLFVAGGDMTIDSLAGTLKMKKEEVEACLVELTKQYSEKRGVVLLRTGNKVRLATNPALGETLAEFLHSEAVSELTRPQLETLTIIAYRAPITKPEIEMIRGVNCTLILRNLMMRGLVEEVPHDIDVAYNVTNDFLSFLGIGSMKELPEFDELSSPDLLDRLSSLASARLYQSQNAEKTDEAPNL